MRVVKLRIFIPTMFFGESIATLSCVESLRCQRCGSHNHGSYVSARCNGNVSFMRAVQHQITGVACGNGYKNYKVLTGVVIQC